MHFCYRLALCLFVWVMLVSLEWLIGVGGVEWMGGCGLEGYG